MRKQAQKVTRFNQRPDPKKNDRGFAVNVDLVFFLKKRYRLQIESDSVVLFLSTIYNYLLSAFELKTKKKKG